MYAMLLVFFENCKFTYLAMEANFFINNYSKRYGTWSRTFLIFSVHYLVFRKLVFLQKHYGKYITISLIF